MGVPIVGLIAAWIGLLLRRRYAARRVIAGEGRFVWLMFVPTLIGPIVVLWAAVGLSRDAPVVGALVAVGALGYGALLVRFLARLSRSVSSTRPDQDLGAAFTDPFADYLSTMSGLFLVGGLVAMVVLIAWAVTRSGG